MDKNKIILPNRGRWISVDELINQERDEFVAILPIFNEIGLLKLLFNYYFVMIRLKHARPRMGDVYNQYRDKFVAILPIFNEIGLLKLLFDYCFDFFSFKK